MSDVVLKVENLYKRYRLGTVGAASFKEDIQRLWAKLRGKPDPFEKYITSNELSAIKTPEEMKNLKARYVWALQDINFEVKRGEIVGIIGKNGAGKSTLLKILSKTTAPTRGQVKIKGRVASLLEVGTGFHPELTGRENIYLNGHILGMTRHEVRSRLDEIVDFAGVEAYLDTPVKRYSSGMYVRLAFAVAAHLLADILIVDEVLAVGDAEFQKKCIGKMKDVSTGEGRTVLFVSHNMGTIKGLCTRGVLIKNGRIEGDGDVLSIINQYLKGINPLDGVFEIGKYDLNEKIIINYVVFKNQNGEIKQSFHIGDSLTVELHCVAVERIENPLFWIGVESEYGSLFGANSLIDGCSPDYVEGNFVISCTFKSLPLLPQSFTVWAGARDKSGMNFLTKSKEIGYFNIITKLSDVGFNSVLSDTIAANSSPLMLPYQWNFGSGKKYNVNIENYIRC